MTTSSVQPFTWEAYLEAMEENPEFDLFSRFSFDHLTDFEIERIIFRMRHSGASLKRKGEALRRQSHNGGQG